jgi:hypothetical protein
MNRNYKEQSRQLHAAVIFVHVALFSTPRELPVRAFSTNLSIEIPLVGWYNISNKIHLSFSFSYLSFRRTPVLSGQQYRGIPCP